MSVVAVIMRDTEIAPFIRWGSRLAIALGQPLIVQPPDIVADLANGGGEFAGQRVEFGFELRAVFGQRFVRAPPGVHPCQHDRQRDRGDGDPRHRHQQPFHRLAQFLPPPKRSYLASRPDLA